MSAIITNQFRIKTAQDLIEQIADTNNSFYMFFAKSTEYDSAGDAIDPINDILKEQFKVRNELLGMKKISSASDISMVIPRKNWSSGTIYDEFTYDSDLDALTNGYVVMTDTFKVYMCLKTGRNSDGTKIASVIEPDHVDSGVPSAESDGYIWKYIYTISASDVNKFVSTSFIPVKNIIVDPGQTDAYYSQFEVYNNAVAGAIHRIDVTNGGSGYTDPTTITVTIDGDGTGCSVISNSDEIILSNGSIVDIKVDPTRVGSGYTKASVTISDTSGGSNATAEVLISPPEGFGSNFISDTNSHYLGFSTAFDGDGGSGEFPVGINYRQLGIIRNPISSSSGSIIIADKPSPIKSLTTTTAIQSAFSPGETIVGSSSSAQGIVIEQTDDGTTYTIRYIQNENTGFKEFTAGETITSSSKTASNIVLVESEIKNETGDILFIENRSAVGRTSDTTESVKLVIEF